MCVYNGDGTPFQFCCGLPVAVFDKDCLHNVFTLLVSASPVTHSTKDFESLKILRISYSIAHAIILLLILLLLLLLLLFLLLLFLLLLL